jgi:cellulose synthase/poly-beta-1,6-N-acetylglucosamine synthase-like glycosyltransferase
MYVFHQQLHNFKVKKHENAQWQRVFVYVGCVILFQPTGLLCKVVYHWCRRLMLSSVSSVSVACVCLVILFSFTVTLKKRNVIINYVGVTVSLKSVSVLCLYLEVSSKPSFELALRGKNIKLHLRLWHLDLSYFTFYNSGNACIVLLGM